MADEQQRALEKALTRVAELEQESANWQRQYRNAREAKDRAFTGAGQSHRDLMEARVEIDRLTRALADAPFKESYHSDRELWRHRQMAYQWTLGSATCALEDGDWSVEKLELNAAQCINEGFGAHHLDQFDGLYERACRTHPQRPDVEAPENVHLTPVIPPHQADRAR